MGSGRKMALSVFITPPVKQGAITDSSQDPLLLKPAVESIAICHAAANTRFRAGTSGSATRRWPMASSTGWSTMPTVSRCEETLCARIARGTRKGELAGIGPFALIAIYRPPNLFASPVR
jgi:hypothetical protein